MNALRLLASLTAASVLVAACGKDAATPPPPPAPEPVAVASAPASATAPSAATSPTAAPTIATTAPTSAAVSGTASATAPPKEDRSVDPADPADKCAKDADCILSDEDVCCPAPSGCMVKVRTAAGAKASREHKLKKFCPLAKVICNPPGSCQHQKGKLACKDHVCVFSPAAP
jgi:hypothetical protein